MEEMIEETDGILLSLSEEDVEARNRANQDRMMYEQVLQQEQEKRKKWHRENVLRKHNFIPIIYNLLRNLAEKDQLDPLVAQAKEKAKNRRTQ
ncbi:hypothetical protein G6F42_019989 [Rhizopus arrhizus]|nr:hypothetical protein G6F42_019989 [Rhizopus arrhizus]